MENLSPNQPNFFKGAGWLLGISLSVVGALVVFTLSDSFVAAISAALPIGIFTGIGLEQKFQKENRQVDTKKTNMMIRALLLGFIIFVAIYIMLHL